MRVPRAHKTPLNPKPRPRWRRVEGARVEVNGVLVGGEMWVARAVIPQKLRRRR